METPEDHPSTGSEALRFLRMLVGFPLALFGGIITAFFCIGLSFYISSRIGGGPRPPGFLGFCMLWVVFGLLPLVLGTGLFRGTLRFPASGKVGGAVLLLVLALGLDALCGPKNWHSLFRPERIARGDAAAFKTTYVTPHLDWELRPGTNVVWCGTFQLAWNEACALAGGDLQLVGRSIESLVQHPMAAALNQHAFSKDCIDPESYVALAGFAKDRIHELVQAAVKEKFKGAFKPSLIPDKAITPRPQDFIAYACLLKRLSFATPFEKLEDAFSFGGVRVRAFGMGQNNASHAGMCEQVRILNYGSETNFVIELTTTSKGDRLILAKVQPKSTLVETLADVRARANHGRPEPAGTNDVLVVPRVSLDLHRKYSEIEHCWLVPLGRKVAWDLFLLSAEQSIRFEMDEKGVELESEAHMGFACAAVPQPSRQHIMIFDRPFLLLLERTGARTPYFAMWVDNPELLVKW